MNIIRTGVFATEEEVKRAIELYQIAQRTPVIAMSVRHGIERGGFAGEAWTHMQETVHGYAMAHGLPDFSGWYGLDCANREFIKTEGLKIHPEPIKPKPETEPPK